MTKRFAGGMLLALAILAAGGSTAEGQSYAPFRGFEIQSSPATRAPWIDAASYCALKEGGRLCRASEWAVACRNGRFKPGGSPEWVDEVAPDDGASRLQSRGPAVEGGLRALALVDCDRGTWQPIRETLPVRCCRTRPDAPSAR